jgi:hypothetical protein
MVWYNLVLLPQAVLPGFPNLGKDRYMQRFYASVYTAIGIYLLIMLLGTTAALAANTAAHATADEAEQLINSVDLLDSSGNMLSTPVRLNPHSTYRLEVNITDNNMLEDIDQVEVVLYYDSDGTSGVPSEGDPSTAALMTWNRDGGGFELDAGASTTWTLHPDNSSAPADDDTTGSWCFEFTVGDIAQQTETELDSWRLSVNVIDEADSTPISASSSTFNNGETAFEVNHYSRLESISSAVVLGHAQPGEVLSETPIVDLEAVANGRYTIELAVDPTWTGTAGNTLTTAATLENPQEIRIVGRGGAGLAGDDDTYGDPGLELIDTTATPVRGLENIIGPTPENGFPLEIKLAARLSPWVLEDAYEGTLYVTVVGSEGAN